MIRVFRAALLLAGLVLATPIAAQTITPQGRLTLTSGAPVMVADVTGATTVYYDCYAGNTVPVGATPTNLTIGSCEVSMGLSSTNVAAGSVYDVFAVNNAGTLAICAGPAWSSTSSRGTGAGTTQIDQTNGGLWTNANALTHCYGGSSGTTDYGSVAAHASTYLGSLYATTAGQTGMQFQPSPAAGGTNNILGLYNAYNRVPIRAISRESTASWTYASTTWRPANNSTSNRITWLDGLAQSQAAGSYAVDCNTGGNTNCLIGVAFNSTTATPGGITGYEYNTEGEIAGGDIKTGLGLNYVQAMEARGSTGTATLTFWSSVSGVYASGLSLSLTD